MSESRTYQGHVYTRNGPNDPWTLAGPAPVTIGRPDAQKAETTTLDIQAKKIAIAKAQRELDNTPDSADLSPDVLASIRAGKPIRLEDLSPGDQGIVTGLLRGDLPAGARSIASKTMLPYIKMAMAVDPTFSANTFTARTKATTQLADMKATGGYLSTLSASVDHSRGEEEAIRGLGNPSGAFGRLGGAYLNNLFFNEGGPAGAEFTRANDIYSGENVKAVVSPPGSNQGGALADRQESRSLITASMPQDAQFRSMRTGAIQTYQKMMTVNDGYRRTMNTDIPGLVTPDQASYLLHLMRLQDDGTEGPIPAGLNPGFLALATGKGDSGKVGSVTVDPANPATSAPIFDALNKGAYGQRTTPETIDTEFKGVDNPEMRQKNQHLLGMVTANVPDDQILAAAANLGIDPAATGLNGILAYRKKTGLLKYADTTDYQTKVPLSTGEKIVNSVVANPAVEFASEAGNAAGAGLPQAIATAVGPADMQRKLDAARNTSPRAAIAGKMAGTVAGAAGTELAATKLLAGTRFAAQGARAGDVAYGAVAGATGNPDDPVMGAVRGGVENLLGGEMGRGVIGTTASAISPTGGKYADLYPDGVRPTLGQRVAGTGVVGDAVNTGEQALGSVPLMGSAIRGARADGMASWERAGFNRALKAIGEKPLPKDIPVGPQAMKYVGDKMDATYDTARAGMQFVPDNEFGNALGQWQAKYNTGILTDDAQKQVNGIISNVVGSRLTKGGGVLSGDTYKLATSDLSDAISATSSPEVKLALKDFNDILKAGARRASDPDAVKVMDAADKGWSLFKPLREASAMAGSDPGRFTPTALSSISRRTMGKSRAYIEGDTRLSDYIGRGQAMRDTMGNSGTADRQLAATALLGTGGAVATPAIPAAAVGLTLPYLPGVRKVLSGAMAPREGLASLADNIRTNYQAGGGPVGQGLLDAYLEQRRMQSQPGLAGAYK